jgi:hypothetical protein
MNDGAEIRVLLDEARAEIKRLRASNARLYELLGQVADGLADAKFAPRTVAMIREALKKELA